MIKSMATAPRTYELLLGLLVKDPPNAVASMALQQCLDSCGVM